MKLGILKETKIPPDRRVPFSPGQLSDLQEQFPDLEIMVQEGGDRCFTDEEYRKAGLGIVKDVSPADILMGVKEVETDILVPGRTYLFFSHTAKKQPYNRGLLQEIVAGKITLIDYEYLTDKKNMRLVAFGRWAGIVGAYNGLKTYGERYRLFLLNPAHSCFNFDVMKRELEKVQLPAIKILVTGGGRVAHGAMETLRSLKLPEVSPDEFLNASFDKPVLCRIDPWDYVRRKGGAAFDLQHFFDHPDMYESTFKPYTKVTDLFIACHYWDPRSPVFMTRSDMREPGFKMRVIADISCDIDGPIPSTIRASSIENPVYGYYPLTEQEIPPFELRGITVMAVDNLPGELPRDASVDFGEQLIKGVMPALLGEDKDRIIERATVVKNGELTEHFKYLKDYLAG
jgi:saccharopine dehydrogenase (NAD+, L-lysine-forming)